MSPPEPAVTVAAPAAADTRALGVALARLLRAGDVVLLSGELGAGKTTLAQGLGEGLGVRGPVTSPTFVIARVHPSLRGGPPMVHADAYRLAGWDELEDLDLDATLAEAVTVVEWGGGIAEGLTPDRLEVHLQRPTGNGSLDRETRVVRIRGVGPRWAGTDLAATVGQLISGP